MSIQGWFYLHPSYDLIYIADRPGVPAALQECSFAVGFWAFDGSDKDGATEMLIEALAAGANRDRIMELAQQWGHHDPIEMYIYAKSIGVELFFLPFDGSVNVPGYGGQYGARVLNAMHAKSKNARSVGVGSSPLDALAHLANKLGYAASKKKLHTFIELLLERINSE